MYHLMIYMAYMPVLIGVWLMWWRVYSELEIYSTCQQKNSWILHAGLRCPERCRRRWNSEDSQSRRQVDSSGGASSLVSFQQRRMSFSRPYLRRRMNRRMATASPTWIVVKFIHYHNLRWYHMLKLEEKVGVDEHFQYRSKSHLEVKKNYEISWKVGFLLN